MTKIFLISPSVASLKFCQGEGQRLGSRRGNA